MKIVWQQDMRRYVGTFGVLTFLSESSNAAYVDSFLGLCLQELDIIVQKSLNAETIVQGTSSLAVVTGPLLSAPPQKTTKSSRDTFTSSCLPSAMSLEITLPTNSKLSAACGSNPLICASEFAKMVSRNPPFQIKL